MKEFTNGEVTDDSDLGPVFTIPTSSESLMKEAWHSKSGYHTHHWKSVQGLSVLNPESDFGSYPVRLMSCPLRTSQPIKFPSQLLAGSKTLTVVAKTP